MTLEARRVWYKYPGGPWVLRGATLAVGKGRIVLVTGPNGSGKTTLLKVAAGLLRPQRGSVLVDGVPPGDPGIRGYVVYVHETPIMARGSVLYNASLGLVLRGVPRREAEERARQALRLLGLEGLEDAPAGSLSKGLQARVSLARAIAVEPRYLLLDEPTAHLDRRARKSLLALLESLARESRVGIAVASHDHSLEEVADEVVELSTDEAGGLT